MLGDGTPRDKTAEAIDAGRWMYTGDIWVMDSDGYVAITGRTKDMIIRDHRRVPDDRDGQGPQERDAPAIADCHHVNACP